MLSVKSFSPPRSPSWLAPRAIGLGLAILAAAMIWRLPPVTGMALVVLGATVATLDRYRHTPLLKPMVVAHSATYGGLYALFVGAVIQSSAGQTVGAISIADLTASLGLLAASALLLVGAWRRASAAV